jgi:hypothetical protein
MMLKGHPVPCSPRQDVELTAVQYFLPVSLTLALILGVPSSAGTVPSGLLPALLQDLSYALPLAHGVKVTRGSPTSTRSYQPK